MTTAGQPSTIPGDETREDAELLRRYVDARDEAAFAELVKRQVNLVYRAALRQLEGDTHRAQDAAQVVFTVLARKAATVVRHPSLAGWLYTTTHFAVRDVLRQERRRQVRETEAHMRDEIERDDTSATDWDKLRPVLDGVMRELGDRDREAILGRFFEGRAFAELGRRFGLSDDAARMRVDRAVDKLRALLVRRGVTSTSAALGLMLTAEAAHAAPAGLATAVTGTALASASAAATPLATAIQFMITSKTVAGITGAVLVAAALSTAVHESRARQASAEALSAASTETAKFEAQVRDTRQRASTAEQARDEVAAALAAAQAQAAKSAAVPAPAPIDPVVAGREFLAAHPEAKALWDERERANISSKLGPVFQVMNLTAAEREQIETIFMNTVSGVTTFGTPAGTVALKREATLTRAQAEAQMQEVLGERYPEFMRMSALAPTFDFTVKLATALYRTEPLTPEQATQVMRIFANASPIAKAGPPTIDWNEIQQQASAVLSSTQLAGLTAVRTNFEYNQAVNQLNRPANPPVR